MKTLFVILIAALLTSCATMEKTRTEANKFSFTIDKDYAAVYRLTIRAQQLCGGQATGEIFPDVKEAQMTYISNPAAGAGYLPPIIDYSLDIKDVGAGKTRVDLYSAFSAQRRRMPPLIQGWVDGKTGC